MGGWAALLGGVGAGAQQYGNQVRGFLEGRRRDLADTMLNLAAQEPDEQLRGEYLGHASKLLSGAPMAKMLPAIGKTVQGHLEDNNTLAQLLPPPSGQQQTYAGQAPLGQMNGTRVAEPQMPPSAAMPPTSPVNPLAQAGQEAAGPMVQAPAPATQSPFAFAPTPANIPGTTLPEGSAPQARMSAVPPINPSPADLEQTAAVPQSYVERILQHPYMRTPAGRAMLAPALTQAAEMDRQLGLSHEYVRQKMNYLADYTNQLRQMYQDPNLPQIGRMALQAHAMDMQAWAANPDINARQPTFPLTGGNMLQAMRGRIQSVDVTNMPPDVKGYYGIPESATGAQLLSTDPLSNQIREGGWVGQASPQMRPETVWDNATRSFQQMAVDIGHPGEGPLSLGDQGGRYQYPPAGFARQPIINLQGGGQAYGPSQFDVQQERMRQAAAQEGKLTGGLPPPVPIPGAVNYAGLTNYRTSTQEQTESGTKSTSAVSKGVPPAAAAGGGGLPPARGGAGTVPPTTTGAPPPIARIPGVDYNQVQAAVAQVTRPNLSIAESKALEEKLGVSSTGSLAKTPFARAYRQMIRQKAIDDPNNLITWDSPTANMAQRSTQTLTEINRLETLIARMKQNNELGPLASRWNEFLTNHLGADLSQNHDYVALANGLDLLSTALGFVHGGARGGGSIQMKESFQKHLNVGRMDADTLLGAIGEEKNWLLGYANPSLNNLGPFNLPTTSSPGGGLITPAGTGGKIENWTRDASGRLVRQP